jgi:hypothetical protein
MVFDSSFANEPHRAGAHARPLPLSLSAGHEQLYYSPSPTSLGISFFRLPAFPYSSIGNRGSSRTPL